MLIKENIRRASEVGQDCTLLNSFDAEKGETNIKELTNALLEDLKSKRSWDRKINMWNWIRMERIENKKIIRR